MKTKNLSFNEMLKLITERFPYSWKNKFLMNVLEYEIDTGHLRDGLYFNIFKNGNMLWSIDPLFYSSEQVEKYLKQVNYETKNS